MGVRGCGPKPKGASQHKADGTFRADRHGSRLENGLGGTAPEMPSGLSDGGAKLWATIIDRLPASMLDRLDSCKLEILCRTFDEIRVAESRSEFIKLAQLFDRYGRQFGLSPMDRASIKAQPPTDEEDEAEKYLRDAGLKVTG